MLTGIRRWLESRRRSAAFRMAGRWLRESEALASKLKDDREDLDFLRARLEAVSRDLDAHLAEAEEQARRHGVATSAMRDELKVLEDCVVGPLTMWNQKILKLFEADTAIQVARGVAIGQTNRDVE